MCVGGGDASGGVGDYGSREVNGNGSPDCTVCSSIPS